MRLDEAGRCVGVGDIDKYYTNIFDKTGMKRVVALQDGYRTYLDAGTFVNTKHMSRALDSVQRHLTVEEGE